MGRFNNLEFGEQFEGEFHGETHQKPGRNQQTPLKDEAYYLSEAKNAFEHGEFDTALRAYAKVLEFNPRNAEAWAGQVRMLIELKEFQQAKLWADKGLEPFPNDPELLAAKAVALARLGDLKAALAYSDASVGDGDDLPYIWLARGDVQLARKERRADFCFEKAIALAPHDWFVRWLAARIHYYYKKIAVALKLVHQALAVNASQGVLWLQLGLCQLELGLVSPAKVSFHHARELSPDCHEAEQALRELYQVGFWARMRKRCLGLFRG